MKNVGRPRLKDGRVATGYYRIHPKRKKWVSGFAKESELSESIIVDIALLFASLNGPKISKLIQEAGYGSEKENGEKSS